MVTWENKPIIIKDDYSQAKLYFETLVKEFEAYMQKSSIGATKKGYKSTNLMANIVDEILKYIQEIPSATITNKERMVELAANIIDTMKKKVTQLTALLLRSSYSLTPLQYSHRCLQTRKLTVAVAAVTEVAAAAAMTADESSSTRTAWAVIVGPMDITPLEQSMTEIHACRKREVLKMMPRQQIGWEEATSGQEPKNSSHPSKSMQNTKENPLPIDRDRGWTIQAPTIPMIGRPNLLK